MATISKGPLRIQTLDSFPVNQAQSFDIVYPGLKNNHLSINITNPLLANGQQQPSSLENCIQKRVAELPEPGKFRVFFTAPIVGVYTVEVDIIDQPHLSTRFIAKAYDLSKVLIIGAARRCYINEHYEFNVDASEAGEGQLEIAVNEGEIPNQVRVLDNGKCIVNFLPEECIPHIVDIKFNGQNVIGCPFVVDIQQIDANHPYLHIDTSNINLIKIGKRAKFRIYSTKPTVNNHDNNNTASKSNLTSNIKVIINSPSNKVVPHDIDTLESAHRKNLGDESSSEHSSDTNSNIWCEFTPVEVGQYNIQVLYMNEHLPESPFISKAYDASKVLVTTEFGLGAQVDKPVKFSINASHAGEGSLEISVTSCSDGQNILTKVNPLGGAIFEVIFVPKQADDHQVNITFNGQPVLGNPFMVPVKSSLSYQSISKDANNSAKSPTSNNNNNNLFHDNLSDGVATTSRTDPITVIGVGSKFAKLNEKTLFYISNLSNDKNDLVVKIEDPQGQLVPSIVTREKSLGVNGNIITAKVEYITKSVGEYLIYLHYKGLQLPNTPYKCKSYNIDAIKVKKVPKEIELGKEQTFIVDASNAGPGIMEIIVTSNRKSVPNFVKLIYPEDAQTDSKHKKQQPDTTCVYSISFTPVEMANHIIEILFNKEKIPRIPIVCQMIGLEKSITPNSTASLPTNEQISSSKSKDSPSLIIRKEERLLVGSRVEFFFDTNDVFNKDDITILSPDQKSVDFAISKSVKSEESDRLGEKNLTTSYKIEFIPRLVGDYLVDITRNHKIAKSGPSEVTNMFPFSLQAYDHTKVKVSEVNDGVLGHPVYFFIDASQAGSGNLEIIVCANGRNVPNYVQSEGNAAFRVNFKPFEATDHLLSVKFNGQPVPGSPYKIKVSNASQSQISGIAQLKTVPVNHLVQFNIDYVGQGNSKKQVGNNLDEKECIVNIVSPTNRQTKANVEMIKSKDSKTGTLKSSFSISFVPIDIGPHQITAMVGNELVPGCPITCNVYDVKKVEVDFGESARPNHKNLQENGHPVGYLNQPVTFQVDASKAGEGILELVVTTEKSSVKAEVLMKSRGLYNVTFIPRDKLTHFVEITFNDEEVPDSPFRVDIFDEATVSSKDLTSTLAEISLDTSSKPHNQNSAVKNKLLDVEKEYASGIVGISNVVYLEPGIVDDSRYYIKILSPTNDDIQYTVQRASSTDNEGQTITKSRIEYQPQDIGSHTIEVHDKSTQQILKYYYIEVCDPNQIRVACQNEGLANKQHNIKIDASRAGKIKLDIQICGPSASNSQQQKVLEHTMSEIVDNIYSVSFIPSLPGTHTIDIRCHGHPISASPIVVDVKKSSSKSGNSQLQSEDTYQTSDNITVHGTSLKSSPVGRSGAFVIETGGYAQAKDFDVIITDPNNSPVDVQCYIQQDGNLLAEWTPERVGTHRIEVLYMGKQVSDSPYRSEAFDVSSIMISGVKSIVYPVNERIQFNLDRRNAGYGELDVTITSPVGKNLPIDVRSMDNKDQGEVISFTPTAPGKYKISITFSGYEVPGSPITFIAQDVAGQVRAAGDGLKMAHSNENNSFVVESSHDGQLKVRIECGDREIVPKIEKKGRNYLVHFKPTELGYANLSLYWNGAHINGSPFSVPVVDLSKIQFLSGTDKLSSITNKKSDNPHKRAFNYDPYVPKEITLDVSKCGPGKLRAEAVCQSNLDISFPVHVDQYVLHRYRLTFTCPPSNKMLPKCTNVEAISASEIYLIKLYYNDIAVDEPLSPVIAFPSNGNSSSASAKPSTSESLPLNNNQAPIESTSSMMSNDAGAIPSMGASQQVNKQFGPRECPTVVLKGHGLAGARCGEEGEFTIDGSEAGGGHPVVKLSGNKSNIDIQVIHLEGKLYKAIYTPTVVGTYLLNVLWDGKQVRGCPLKINILPSCDANRVICTGDGLKGGILGKEIKTFIDTRRAGPGELTALCNGPNKVAFCELLDQGDGTFILFIKPQESGRHYLTIKYGDVHIPRSPFTIKVSGAPEASKVRVHGPGIEHGVLPLYQSRFICDTRGAGAGQLTVRIRGPKGAFRMETQRENQRDRTILCKYDPTEPGDYRIEIKWAGVHVPGSPFTVMIFDTQDELNRFLTNGLAHLPTIGNFQHPLAVDGHNLNPMQVQHPSSTYGGPRMNGRGHWRTSASEI